jgi:hypothetical protein
MHFNPAFSWPAMGTLVAELSFVGVLHLLPRLGKTGAAMSAACTRAPLLDGIVAALTWVPWLAAGLAAGWVGVAGSLLGQAEALLLWTAIHELTHRQAVRGPRIVKVINRVVGRWRNYAALWVTLVALPGFWLIRLHELLAYPFLVGLLKFPPYRQSEWVNVSRQKFEGLVGHDLVWCLYCDWMTGVYSLGAEMLRNVESFWCPIRFYDGKKCENCRTDFPDIDHGWVPATGTMKDVTDVLEEKYADGQRTWFGHPTRLTVRGQPIVEASTAVEILPHA